LTPSPTEGSPPSIVSAAAPASATLKEIPTKYPALARLQPRALEDPEAGGQREADRGEDWKPEQPEIAPHDVEAGAHQLRAVGQSRCHEGHNRRGRAGSLVSNVTEPMRVRWFGQSAFLLAGERSVFIDPFGEMEGLASRGLQFDYPAIDGVSAELVLVTHEHADHSAADVIAGSPVVLRSTAGKLDSPVGEVVAVASEHDGAAGTERGPNTIFCFTLDGLRIAHLGDFGQEALRPEQRSAIGEIDVLFIPVGGGPTIGGPDAASLARSLTPRLVIPMHYRTPAVNFLDPPEEFLDALGYSVERLDSSEADLDRPIGTKEAPAVALFAPPG
jgi:L-ascorbate metabolism protein UlaG (beta-lactamase superfamily)